MITGTCCGLDMVVQCVTGLQILAEFTFCYTLSLTIFTSYANKEPIVNFKFAG